MSVPTTLTLIQPETPRETLARRGKTKRERWVFVWLAARDYTHMLCETNPVLPTTETPQTDNDSFSLQGKKGLRSRPFEMGGEDTHTERRRSKNACNGEGWILGIPPSLAMSIRGRWKSRASQKGWVWVFDSAYGGRHTVCGAMRQRQIATLPLANGSRKKTPDCGREHSTVGA